MLLGSLQEPVNCGATILASTGLDRCQISNAVKAHNQTDGDRLIGYIVQLKKG